MPRTSVKREEFTAAVIKATGMSEKGKRAMLQDFPGEVKKELQYMHEVKGNIRKEQSSDRRGG